jgi:hypothetical protein
MRPADTTMAGHEEVPRPSTVYFSMPRKRSRFSCRPAGSQRAVTPSSYVTRLQLSIPCRTSCRELAWTVFTSLDFRLVATFATSPTPLQPTESGPSTAMVQTFEEISSGACQREKCERRPSIPSRYIGRNPTARIANCASKYLDAKRARI